MEVIMMPPPGPNLAQPAFVAGLVLTHPHLGARKNEDSVRPGILRRRLDDLMMRPAPIPVGIRPVRPPHRDRRDALPLRPAQVQPIRRPHPDIRIHPDLMTAMPRQHRPAPRLADIADIKPAPARLRRCETGKILNETNGFRVSPIAVPVQPHGLPCRPRLGKLHTAGETALGISAKWLGRLR